MHLPVWSLALAVCLLCPLFHATARAETPDDAPVLHRKIQVLKQQLGAAPAAEQGSVLQALGDSRYTDDAARVLRDYLLAGQPDELADAAVEALGKTGSVRALDVLSRFRRHRRPGLRRRVYAAIAKVEDPAALPMLVDGLRDSDPSVRGVAARALGDRKATDQLPALFRALTRGVPAAADAIGRIGSEADLERYHGSLETLPIGVMLDGYRRFLERRDLTEQAQLDLVGRLGEVASPTVKTFLRSLLDQLDFRDRKRLRFAIEQTQKRIDDHPEERPR